MQQQNKQELLVKGLYRTILIDGILAFGIPVTAATTTVLGIWRYLSSKFDAVSLVEMVSISVIGGVILGLLYGMSLWREANKEEASVSRD
jgi:hypothetical protein